MARILFGIFIILHGLVHAWYIVLGQKWVAFRPEMGWNGRSWLFTGLLGDPTTRLVASLVYGLACAGLIIGGIGWLTQTEWATPLLVGGAALSAVGIVLFWDGSGQRIVEKGLLGLILSLLIIAVALLLTRYNTEISAAYQKIDLLGSQVVQTPCGPVEYARVGSGDPVLVVHGNAGGFDQGLSMAGGYIGAGFDVIAVSRFGYLLSPMPENATVDQQADAFACLLDALRIEKAAVFTSSAGVTSSVAFALRHPERLSALVLHSPNAPADVVGLTPPPQPVFKGLMGSDFLWWACSTYLRPLFQTLVGVPKGFELTPQYQINVIDALQGVNPSSLRADGMIFDTYVGNPVINTIPLEEVTVPTLVISAVDDPMALHPSAITLAERIPGARLMSVADGGHLMLGHTAEVRQAIADFIRQDTAGR